MQVNRRDELRESDLAGLSRLRTRGARPSEHWPLWECQDAPWGASQFLRVRVLRLRKSSIRSGIFVEHPYRMAQAPSGAASRVLPSSYAAPMELNRTLWLAST